MTVLIRLGTLRDVDSRDDPRVWPRIGRPSIKKNAHVTSALEAELGSSWLIHLVCTGMSLEVQVSIHVKSNGQ